MKFTAPTKPDRFLWLLLGVVLAGSLWFALQGWDRPILDRHEFRQVQTAITAYWIREAGYHFDYLTPLFGPPWSFPMEFPLYQVVVGKLSHGLGTDLEATGRAVNLLFLLAAMPPVYALAGFLGLKPSRRLLVAATVLSSPVHLFYARTFMIESTALCFSLWFTYALARGTRVGGTGWIPLAAVLGTLAALSKTTTFLIFLPPAVLTAFAYPREREREYLRGVPLAVAATVPIIISLGIALLWVRHSDLIKHSNPFTGFLASTELAKWNWGTLDQRLSAEFWIQLGRNVSAFVLSEIALVPWAVGLVVAPAPLRRTALAATACFFGGALLFSNLFHIHDYYYNANATLLLFGAGLLLAAIWNDEQLAPGVRRLLLASFFGAQLLIFHRGYADYLRRQPALPPGIAEVVRDTTPGDGVILVYGWDWNGVIPYYAQRRAIMVPDGRDGETRVLDDIVARVPPRRIVGLVVATNTLRTASAFLRERADRFGLGHAPLATSEQGDFYLVEDLAPAAGRSLKGKSYRGVSLNLAASGEPAFPADRPVDVAPLALPIFSPAPRAAHTLFGMSAGQDGAAPVLHAHAPSELEFRPPPGARSIRATFGLPDAAWNSGPAVTDGVGVEVFERLPSGQVRPLFRRSLDPARTAADRGPQSITLENAGPFSGPVFFRFNTGEKGNTTNDWSYWSRIEIR